MCSGRSAAALPGTAGRILALNEIADGLVEASARELVVHAQEEFAKQTDPGFVLEDVARETARCSPRPAGRWSASRCCGSSCRR